MGLPLIAQFAFWIFENAMLWLIYKKLVIVARDTAAREDLDETIKKFAALAGSQREKVVAFKVKVKDGEE